MEIKSLLGRLAPVDSYAIDWSSRGSDHKTENLYEETNSDTGRMSLKKDLAVDESLEEEFRKLKDKSIGYKNMKKFRSKLPAYSCRQEIVDLVSNNQVCIEICSIKCSTLLEDVK